MFHDKDYQYYIDLLQKHSSECQCIINSFCIMKNHVHLLAVPKHELSLAKMMQKVSLVYTQYINRKYNRTGRLWECRYHSCIVDKDPYLLSVCRYIETNPVRANLVKEADSYKWSSIKVNTTGDKSFSFAEPIWKHYADRKEYIKFLHEKEDKAEHENIRKATCAGRPYGTDKFIELIGSITGTPINTRGRGRPRK